LLQLDSISFDPRQRFCRFGVSHYALLVQIAAHQGKGVPDELIYVERGPVQITLLEDGSNAFDHSCRAIAISDDLAECRLRFER
jgi:hypothetical protein